MGNGPRTATFLDQGEGDWLKKKTKKKETLQTHNSSRLSHFLSFSEWSVEDGLIGLGKKRKKLSFQGIAGNEKRAEEALCRPQGLDLSFWERVKTEGKRERLVVFTGPQTELLNWLTVKKMQWSVMSVPGSAEKILNQWQCNQNENQMLNISLDIYCRMPFAFFDELLMCFWAYC